MTVDSILHVDLLYIAPLARPECARERKRRLSVGAMSWLFTHQPIRKLGWDALPGKFGMTDSVERCRPDADRATPPPTRTLKEQDTK